MRTKSRKALSPVIASIILIAVTVAVSIAVAAWMGALSFSFMNTGEQLQLGSPYGWASTSNTVPGSATNTTVLIRASVPSGNAVTISGVRVNSVAASFLGYTPSSGTFIAGAGPFGPISAQSYVILNITIAGTTVAAWQSSFSYTLVITTAKNNEFQTTGTCP